MKKDIKQSNKRIQKQFGFTIMSRDAMNKDIEHLRFLQTLFYSDYALSLFYYRRFSHLLILYPFYCINPVLELGRDRLEEVKKIMFGIRCTSKEEMSEENMYKKAIQRILVGIVSDRKKLICDEHEKTGGKLFSGGFSI